MKHPNLYRLAAGVCAALLLLCGPCACGDGETLEPTDGTTASSPASSASAAPTAGTSGESTSSGETTSSSGTSSSDAGDTPTTGTTVSPVSHRLTAALEQWHPGVLGYDADYLLSVELDGVRVRADRLTYTCDAAGVRFDGAHMTVSSDTRQKGVPLTVHIRDNETGAETALSVPCKAWEQTFGDEFDGTALDGDKWTTFEEGSGGTISMQYRDNAQVRNGKLELSVRKETITYNGKTYEYTQGGVCTNGRFKQIGGLFTAAMKIPTQSSLNSAFWLIPGGGYGRTYMCYDSTAPQKGLAEIDIVEISNYWGNKYCIGEHFYDTEDNLSHSSRGASYVALERDATEHFVEYSVAWLENGLYYYADGRLMYADEQITPTGADDRDGRAAFIILTLGLYDESNSWCGPFRFTDDDFPITLQVDFVRAYR